MQSIFCKRFVKRTTKKLQKITGNTAPIKILQKKATQPGGEELATSSRRSICIMHKL
jgi:hypothetical protein